jgi:hypothetical protein
MGGSGWRRRVLQGFFERRQQAWDRVYELEEKAEAPPDFKRTTADLERSIEVLKAGDPDGLRRLAEQSEQTRRQQEQTRTQQEQARTQQEQARAEAPRARRRVMLRFELPFAVLGIVLLLTIAALNYLWLGALAVDYFDFYLRDGFQVALLFTIVGYAISLDSRPGLIAAHPTLYVAEVFVLFTALLGSLSALFGSPRSDRDLADAGLDFLGRRFRLGTVDLALGWLFTLLFGAAMLAWAVLIAPLQYWVNLLCGAPAREVVASSKTLWLVENPPQTTFLRAPKNPNEFQRKELERERGGGNMTEIGFAVHPVTFTSGIASAALFGISQLA